MARNKDKLRDLTVVVWLREPWCGWEGLPNTDETGEQARARRMWEAGKHIESEIKKHLDHDDYKGVTIKASYGACEFCGAEWTEASDTYNGGCCDEDEKSAPAQEVA